MTKDHMYGAPIVDLKFHSSNHINMGSERRIMSADKHIVKVWETTQGKSLMNVEPEHDIKDVCIWKDSGLIMIACDDAKMQVW